MKFSHDYCEHRSDRRFDGIRSALVIEGLGVSHQQLLALHRACATSPDLPLFRTYRDRRSSAVPVAPCDGGGRSTMERTGRRGGVVAIIAHACPLFHLFEALR